MTTQGEPLPFSRRQVRPSDLRRGEFPQTARNLIEHLLFALVERGYVRDWIDIERELARAARAGPVDRMRNYDPDTRAARASARTILSRLSWPGCLDFCERIWSHLAQEGTTVDELGEDQVDTPLPAVRNHIAGEIQRIFDEEGLAYRFVEGSVIAVLHRHTDERVLAASSALLDPRLDEARIHFSKAVKFLGEPRAPDLENAVKEAACAVESAAKALFPKLKGNTLSDLLPKLTSGSSAPIPSPLKSTFDGIYGFRGSAQGVAHGAASGAVVTRQIAEYVLSVAASQIVLLQANAPRKGLPPSDGNLRTHSRLRVIDLEQVGTQISA